MTISVGERIALAAELALFDGVVISAEDAAAYVEKMCAELAAISDRAGLGFLGYLLEVAREEARLHAPAPQPRVMHGELPPR